MTTNSIALAYCADNEEIVAKLESQLAPSNYSFQRFSCNRATSSNFLTDQLLGQSDPILLFISDNFLRSAQCMSRGLKLLQERRHDIQPIIINGVTKDPITGEHKTVHTEFERVSDIIQYINYWQDQYLDLRRQKREMSEFDEHNFNAHLKVMREVSSEVGEFLRLLRSMNCLSLPQFQANAYQQFFIFTEDQEAWGPFQSKFQAPAPEPAQPQRETPPQQQAPQEEEEEELNIADIPGINMLHIDDEPEDNDLSLEDNGADLTLEENEEEEEVEASTPDAEQEIEREEEAQADEGEDAEQGEAPILEDAQDLYEAERAHAAPGEHEGQLETAEDEESAQREIVANALQFLNNGQQEAGLSLMDNAIRQYPQNSSLRYHYALMLAKEHQDYGAARQVLAPVMEFDPEHTDALFLLGELAELGQDFASAKAYYLQLVEQDEAFPNAHYRLGMITAAHFEDEREEAAGYFRTAAKQDKGNYDALYQYAMLLSDTLNQPKRAIKYFKKTLKANAFHPFAYYDMALVYHKMGEYEKAADAYKRAIQINPELQTPENDEAFALPEVVKQSSEPSRATLAVSHSALDAMKHSIQQLEDLLRQKESETAQLQAELATQEMAPSTPPQPKVDKTVLITGASSGIGRATAMLFAEQGYRVIITGRRADRLEELQSALREDYQAEVITRSFDLRSERECQAALSTLEGHWAQVDILINNAGKAKGLAPIHEGELRHWEEMIDTNLKGLLYITRIVTPAMVARGSGQIINVCSTAGKEVYPNGNVYCATKAAVDTLTRAMRVDLHKHGLRVGMVSPAHVEETEFALVRFDGDAERARIYEDFKPLNSHDVAQAIFFMVTQPAHVNVLDVVLQGTQQASSTIIDRSGRERYEEEE